MIRRADGTLLLRSREPLASYPHTLTERLIHWAGKAPEHIFVAQRGADGGWCTVNYAQTLDRVRRIGQALLDRELSLERPIAILSDNSIEHLLLALAAQHVGIPYAPIAPAYSLVSSDFAKLRHVLELLTPGLIFAQSGARFAAALQAGVPSNVEVVIAEDACERVATTLFDELLATEPTGQVDAAHASTGPNSIAKILFTSGSTGLPKGVINTQRMLCANQQQIAQTFPFLQDEALVIVDWLPWNHTFGGNHNVGMILFNGGTLYIDAGKPIPGGIAKTVANLREIAPTVYFNVPKGFEELVNYFRREPGLRENFFSRVKMLFYAGAGLPQHVWDALDELSTQTVGERIPIVSGLGCTESGPAALFSNWAGGWSGLLGVPVPGLELKLVASGDKLEARYLGPNVTPGYWRQRELTEAAFDEEGFYCTGDALKLVDPEDAEQGLVFDGRIAEDFKLLTGTWVNVGNLRAAFIAAGAPLVQDVVIAGHDRNYLAAMIFPDLEACRTLCPELSAEASADHLITHTAVRAKVQKFLDRMAHKSTGSASRVMRAILIAEPPSIDAGEITDKRSINQRAVLKNRAALVAGLYEEPPSSRVIVVSREE